jgi:hypothetical protein
MTAYAVKDSEKDNDFLHNMMKFMSKSIMGKIDLLIKLLFLFKMAKE